MDHTTHRPSEAPASLKAEVAEIDAEYKGWHCWLSDTGSINATSPKSDFGGSGTTLSARTPDLMRQAIAEQEHAWSVAA